MEIFDAFIVLNFFVVAVWRLPFFGLLGVLGMLNVEFVLFLMGV